MPPPAELVRTGAVDPLSIITEQAPMQDALAAYEAFDARLPGWPEVELPPET